MVCGGFGEMNAGATEAEREGDGVVAADAEQRERGENTAPKERALRFHQRTMFDRA